VGREWGDFYIKVRLAPVGLRPPTATRSHASSDEGSVLARSVRVVAPARGPEAQWRGFGRQGAKNECIKRDGGRGVEQRGGRAGGGGFARVRDGWQQEGLQTGSPPSTEGPPPLLGHGGYARGYVVRAETAGGAAGAGG
jgi:hypothetical protein